jgi:hypothetical protein
MGLSRFLAGSYRHNSATCKYVRVKFVSCGIVHVGSQLKALSKHFDQFININ